MQTFKNDPTAAPRTKANRRKRDSKIRCSKRDQTLPLASELQPLNALGPRSARLSLRLKIARIYPSLCLRQLRQNRLLHVEPVLRLIKNRLRVRFQSFV